jgi:hypothetical protein
VTRAHASRRRGSTYTLFMLVFSSILLATGGLYVDATQQTFAYGAHQARASQLREAAFAGARWAQRAADAGETQAEGAFMLYGSSVTVRFKRIDTDAGPAIDVLSKAKGVERTITLSATLRPIDGSYRLDTFSVR